MLSRMIKRIVRNNAARYSIRSKSTISDLRQTTDVGRANQTALLSNFSKRSRESSPFSLLNLPPSRGICQRKLNDISVISSTISSQARSFSSQQTPPLLNVGGQQKPGEALAQYSTDLTQMAMDGKLDPVIGRHEEIRRTLQILARRTKNNPILIGEPGTYLMLRSTRLIRTNVPDILHFFIQKAWGKLQLQKVLLKELFLATFLIQ